MSGDWIKMRADLHTHPKVVRMASALNADRLRVIGALHAVWCLFDVHSVDGSLSGYTLQAVDDLIGFGGFSHAMAAVQWLKIDPDGLLLPEFDEHNGQSAKRRAMEAQRKRREREEAQAEADRKASALDADKKRTREEKRREDSKNPPTPRKRGAVFDAKAIELPAWMPPELWLQWCEDRQARKKPITKAGAKLQLAKLDGYRQGGHTPQAVIEHSIAGGYQGLFAPAVRTTDVRTSTVPGRQGPDPELARIEADRKLATKPSPATLAKLAELRKGVH